MKKKYTVAVCAIIFLVALFFPKHVAAEQEIDPERLKMAATIKKLIEEEDSYAAIESIQDTSGFDEVVKRYHYLVLDLYWQEKALHAVIPVGRAGILYCLTKAQELAEKDSVNAAKMLRFAKIISYNLASFTWPGWDEKGIVITEDALTAGLEAAKLNVRLVERLGRDPGQLSNAYWVVGAQYLALKDYVSAIGAFESAVAHARAAGSKESELMNNGYIAITKIIEGSDKEKAQKDLNKTIDALKNLKTEDANFFANQLQDVLPVFTK